MPQAKLGWGSFFSLIMCGCLRRNATLNRSPPEWGRAQAYLATAQRTVNAGALAHMLMEVARAYKGLAAWTLGDHAAIRHPVLALAALGQDNDQDLANAAGVHIVWGDGNTRAEAQGGEEVAAVHWIAMRVLEVGGAGHVVVGDTAHGSGPSGKKKRARRNWRAPIGVLLDLLFHRRRRDGGEAIPLHFACIAANQLALGDFGDIVQVGVDRGQGT